MQFLDFTFLFVNVEVLNDYDIRQVHKLYSVNSFVAFSYSKFSNKYLNLFVDQNITCFSNFIYHHSSGIGWVINCLLAIFISLFYLNSFYCIFLSPCGVFFVFIFILLLYWCVIHYSSLILHC